MFNFLKKKTPVTGKDINGELFDIYITKKEELSEETFIELSNGAGGDEDYE